MPATKHHQHQQAEIAGRLADGVDRHRGQREADRDDLVGVEAVHQPAGEDRPDAAEREQGGDERGGAAAASPASRNRIGIQLISA